MHSGELARLAGVTVRALRHYHQVGVLPEPERGSNGYRVYDAVDLIRVLRIRRLASLGIPLERMPGILDATTETAAALLDDLDKDLQAQVEALTRQRELIARLRAHDAAPDIPPELAPFFAAFAGASLSPEMARFDREQSVLLAHLAGADGMPHIVRFYERLSDPALVTAVVRATERFDQVGPHSSSEDIAALADSFLEALAPAVGDLAESTFPPDFLRATDVFAEHVGTQLNEQQRMLIEELGRRFGELPAP